MLRKLTPDLAKELYQDEDVPAEPQQRPLRFMLTEAAVKTRLDRGILEYSRHPGDYAMDEAGLHHLGYRFLESGAFDAAVRVLELAVRRVPQSANLRDSLGEVYLASGQPEKARMSYERSLARDPSNDNARNMLEQLAQP